MILEEQVRGIAAADEDPAGGGSVCSRFWECLGKIWNGTPFSGWKCKTQQQRDRVQKIAAALENERRRLMDLENKVREVIDVNRKIGELSPENGKECHYHQNVEKTKSANCWHTKDSIDDNEEKIRSAKEKYRSILKPSSTSKNAAITGDSSNQKDFEFPENRRCQKLSDTFPVTPDLPYCRHAKNSEILSRGLPPNEESFSMDFTGTESDRKRTTSLWDSYHWENYGRTGKRISGYDLDSVIWPTASTLAPKEYLGYSTSISEGPKNASLPTTEEVGKTQDGRKRRRQRGRHRHQSLTGFMTRPRDSNPWTTTMTKKKTPDSFSRDLRASTIVDTGKVMLANNAVPPHDTDDDGEKPLRLDDYDERNAFRTDNNEGWSKKVGESKTSGEESGLLLQLLEEAAKDKVAMTTQWRQAKAALKKAQCELEQYKSCHQDSGFNNQHQTVFEDRSSAESAQKHGDHNNISHQIVLREAKRIRPGLSNTMTEPKVRNRTQVAGILSSKTKCSNSARVKHGRSKNRGRSLENHGCDSSSGSTKVDTDSGTCDSWGENLCASSSRTEIEMTGIRRKDGRRTGGTEASNSLYEGSIQAAKTRICHTPSEEVFFDQVRYCCLNRAHRKAKNETEGLSFSGKFPKNLELHPCSGSGVVFDRGKTKPLNKLPGILALIEEFSAQNDNKSEEEIDDESFRVEINTTLRHLRRDERARRNQRRRAMKEMDDSPSYTGGNSGVPKATFVKMVDLQKEDSLLESRACGNILLCLQNMDSNTKRKKASPMDPLDDFNSSSSSEEITSVFIALIHLKRVLSISL
ncbi:unnamed protein product [Notodromas monacha]|uniref:Uncharacterized protein n=1 Tax=Notodromas monacha TaxID=399045 RepID=A0A7R9BJ27_9CRUS|nr:unnamed protein product [Notodromas monacha]CAG0915632.1 unnamed protein product [Notodromas monacha]